MTTYLISGDAELYQLCREVFTDIPGLSCSCTVLATLPDHASLADLYIWDFHPNLLLPEDFKWNPLRHLFLVDRKDLSIFHKCVRTGKGNVLLKPVTRATLATFLTPAVSNRAAESLSADRDEILRCLIQTNLKLQEYDQDRTTVRERAAHDFLAPLTALGGYCGLLLSELPGPMNEHQKEVLRRMQNSIKRLSRMVSSMFELGVGRHVKRLPDLQVGDIRECLNQALNEIAPFADEKSISIMVELDLSGDWVYFEAEQIEQVLVNILDNACKFTPKAGTIVIRAYPFFWERRSPRSSLSVPADRRRQVVADHPTAAGSISAIPVRRFQPNICIAFSRSIRLRRWPRPLLQWVGTGDLQDDHYSAQGTDLGRKQQFGPQFFFCSTYATV
jgi:signal transduction histidine kinase